LAQRADSSLEWRLALRHASSAPATARRGAGEEIELDTRDALDGQVTVSTMAEDLHKVDLNPVHPLTGPSS
jgi:acetamidase/formamidase